MAFCQVLTMVLCLLLVFLLQEVQVRYLLLLEFLLQVLSVSCLLLLVLLLHKLGMGCVLLLILLPHQLGMSRLLMLHVMNLFNVLLERSLVSPFKLLLHQGGMIFGLLQRILKILLNPRFVLQSSPMHLFQLGLAGGLSCLGPIKHFCAQIFSFPDKCFVRSMFGGNQMLVALQLHLLHVLSRLTSFMRELQLKFLNLNI